MNKKYKIKSSFPHVIWFLFLLRKILSSPILQLISLPFILVCVKYSSHYHQNYPRLDNPYLLMASRFLLCNNKRLVSGIIERNSFVVHSLIA